VAYLPTCVVASSRRLLWVNLDPARRCHISMHVRFAPKADKKQIVWVCPLSAISRLTQRSKKPRYSIVQS
jgi:hypothetical protein